VHLKQGCYSFAGRWSKAQGDSSARSSDALAEIVEREESLISEKCSAGAYASRSSEAPYPFQKHRGPTVSSCRLILLNVTLTRTLSSVTFADLVRVCSLEQL
jgi:hypothetical protein